MSSSGLQWAPLDCLYRHFWSFLDLSFFKRMNNFNHFFFYLLQLKKSLRGLAFWSLPMYHQSAELRKVQDLESVIAAQICATAAIIRWRPRWALESSFQCWPTYLSFKKVTKSTVLPTLTNIWKEVDNTENQSPQCVQTFLFISDDNSRAWCEVRSELK